MPLIFLILKYEFAATTAAAATVSEICGIIVPATVTDIIPVIVAWPTPVRFIATRVVLAAVLWLSVHVLTHVWIK